MGNLMKEMGRPQEAVVELRKALNIRLKLLGPGHKDVGTTSNNLGGTLFSLGRLEEALAHLKTALEIRLKVFGAGHQLVAETQYNLALVLRNLGKGQDAKKIFSEAAASFRTAHGPDHPSTRMAEQEAAAPLDFREGSVKAAHEEAKAAGLSIDDWARAKGLNPEFFK
jgi:tetratricopeptide (TPR) repeat protein